MIKGGFSSEKGMIFRSYEEIANLIRFEEENYEIFLEICMIYEEKTVDLLCEEPGESQIMRKRDISKMMKINVSSVEDVKNAYDLAILRENRLEKYLKEQDLLKNSEFLFTFELQKCEKLEKVDKFEKSDKFEKLQKNLEKNFEKNTVKNTRKNNEKNLDFCRKFSRMSFVRLAEAKDDFRTKSLKKFLLDFPRRNVEKREETSLLTYLLNNELDSLFFLIAISTKNMRNSGEFFLLNFVRKLQNYNEKPPLSPKYRDFEKTDKFEKNGKYREKLEINDKFEKFEKFDKFDKFEKFEKMEKKSEEKGFFSREKLKEKEGKLDKDLSSLIERYNRSKNLIESLNEKKPVSSKKDEFSSLEKDILKLKSNIVEKLENSSKKEKFATSAKKISFSKKDVFTQNYPETVKNAKKNGLEKLKGIFEEKETIFIEKIDGFRRINEDLKENLRGYVEKNEGLETEIREKEGLLEKLQESLENCEGFLRKEQGNSAEIKEKCEELFRDREVILKENEDFEKRLQKKIKKNKLWK